MNEARTPFFMVWNVGGHAPTYKHAGENSATVEAERLARLHPGETFVVLRSIGARRLTDMQCIDFTDDSDIPF